MSLTTAHSVVIPTPMSKRIAAAFVIATAANAAIMAIQLSGDYRRLRKA